ncbi:MAG: tetratricopeptide (TPR) repeat protein [Pseudohongiellaceae bacterium]|jgi:tetratricopeptide (TPR) repeat protein
MKFNYRSSILSANASGFYSRSSLMRWQFSFAAIFASIFFVTASTGSFGQDNAEQRILELNEQAALYQEQLSKLNNSYDETTSEVFLALAGIQHELGDFELANRSYLEAIQVLRVSQGLNSEAQLSVMEAFNDSLYAQQSWEQLDSNLHLANYIAGKLFDPQDPRYITSATSLASWKIKAYQTGIYRADDDRSVQEAAKIYRILIDTLPESDPNLNEKKADYLSAQGLAYYYSAQYVADLDLDEFRGLAPATGAQLQCYPLVMSADGPQPVRSACQSMDASDPEIYAAQQRAKNDTVRRHIASMRKSFAQVVEIMESELAVSPRALAEAILRLGDAGLLAQDYSRANSQYSKAWKLLSLDGESAAVREQLMGSPVRVMQGLLDNQLFDSSTLNNKIHGTISFDVTVRGEIKNIGIEGSNAELVNENLGVIAIKLDQSTFRPKIDQGKPVLSRLVFDVAEL